MSIPGSYRVRGYALKGYSTGGNRTAGWLTTSGAGRNAPLTFLSPLPQPPSTRALEASTSLKLLTSFVFCILFLSPSSLSKLYRHTQPQTTTQLPQRCLKECPLSSPSSSSSFLSPLVWHIPSLPLAAEISCLWAELSTTLKCPTVAFP